MLLQVSQIFPPLVYLWQPICLCTCRSDFALENFRLSEIPTKCQFDKKLADQSRVISKMLATPRPTMFLNICSQSETETHYSGTLVLISVSVVILWLLQLCICNRQLWHFGLHTDYRLCRCARFNCNLNCAPILLRPGMGSTAFSSVTKS